MRCRLIAVGWLCMCVLSLNASADLVGPDIDGNIVVWADSDTVYWDDISDGKEPNQVFLSQAASAPAVSGRMIVFEYGSPENVGGFNIDDPSWLFPTGQNNAAKQRYPEISGSRVVWQDYTNPATDPDIFMIDLAASPVTVIAVCDDSARQSSPKINGDIVVWQDNRSGTYQIYWCNVAGNSYSPAPVSPTGFVQSSPAVCGNIVVWAEDRTEDAGQDDTGLDIYAYDLVQGVELPICTDLGNQSYPAICDQLIAWQDDNNVVVGDFDIRVYDRNSGQVQTVATGSDSQKYPAVSGRTVVWENDVSGIEYTTLTTPSHLTLTAPLANEMVQAGSQMLIDWTVEGPIQQVSIDYSTDAGQTWQVVEPNVPAEMAYQWAPVADVDSTDCMIRVSDFDNSEVKDELDGTFTIFQCDETLTADVTGDCFVDLADFAELAAQWLTCGNPYDANWCLK